MDKNNGGPAFPFVEPNEPCSVALGMSLRDYFAAKTLQGLLADTSLHGSPDEFAKRSYQMADAMIAAREST